MWLAAFPTPVKSLLWAGGGISRENRQGNRERRQASNSKEKNQAAETDRKKEQIHTARRKKEKKKRRQTKNFRWRYHGISRDKSQKAGSRWALAPHMQASPGNTSATFNSLAEQSRRSTLQIFKGRWWCWWSFPSHLNSTQTTLWFCHISFRNRLSEGNSTIVFFSFCVFAAFALTWQLPKYILTCKQTWQLTVSTWKIREFQKTILDFPSATSHRVVQELSVPQLSCQKNLAVLCSNEDTQLPLLQNLLTLSWTDANSRFCNKKLKRRGTPKPWVNTDNATCYDVTLRWCMKLTDLLGGRTLFSPHHHIIRLVHFWCYFCVETSTTLLITW